MARVRLTEAACERYTAPAGKREQYFDALTPGLVLRVSGKTPARAGGSKSWSLVYRLRGAQSRMTIGPYPAIGLAAARRAAQGALKLVAEGKDPGAAKAPPAVAADAAHLGGGDRPLSGRTPGRQEPATDAPGISRRDRQDVDARRQARAGRPRAQGDRRRRYQAAGPQHRQGSAEPGEPCSCLPVGDARLGG